MALTVKQRAKRALVSLLLALAGAYGVPLTLTRDSPDTDVKKAWRRVSAKVHPDNYLDSPSVFLKRRGSHQYF